MKKTILTILFDGGCPLCTREVVFLKSRDKQRKLDFVDIDSPDYDPQKYRGITYRDAMGRIHAIREDGQIIQNLSVFQEAYDLIGLGWIYAPTKLPYIKFIFKFIYERWAFYRLKITLRPSLDCLCSMKQKS